MKIAVIETGGKQYLVEEGKRIEIEKINKADPQKIQFLNVLLYADDNNFLVGHPNLENIIVIGQLIKEKKNKTVILKYKSKTRYRKKQGYKKTTWLVEIQEINKK
jgi:large subunit ribosomal protein L21